MAKIIKKNILGLFAAVLVAVAIFNSPAYALPAGRNDSEKAAVNARWAALDSIPGNGWECPKKCGAMWVTAANATGDRVYNRNNMIDLTTNTQGLISTNGNRTYITLKIVGTILGSGDTGSGFSYARIIGSAAKYTTSTGSTYSLPAPLYSKNYIRRDFRVDNFGDVHINNPEYYSSVRVDITDVYKSGSENPVLNLNFKRLMYSRPGVLESDNIGDEWYNIRLKINTPKYQTKARSYVKSGDSGGDSNWGSASRTIKVNVGDKIYFKHTLENVGTVTKDAVSNVVVRANDDYTVAHQLKDSGLQSNAGVVRGSGVFAQASPVGSKQLNSSYLTYNVKASDAGKTLCTRIEFIPSSRNLSAITDNYQQTNSNRIGYTNFACAYVSLDYDIVTKIPVGGNCASGDSCDKEDEPGTPEIPIPSIIDTPSTGTKIRSTNWKLTYYVVKPNNKSTGKNVVRDQWGNSRNGGFFSNNGDPCAVGQFYNQPGSVYQSNESDPSRKIQGCTVINSGTIDSARGSVKVEGLIYGELGKFSIPENAEIGTKYCFALSVSPYTIMPSWSKEEQESFVGWHHGKPGCIVVVKKPKAQILGAGLFANGGAYGTISGRSVNGTNRAFGSWVEYEIVSNGANSNVASNGVFGYPNGATGFAGGTKNAKVQNRLTFANKSGSYGNFGVSYSSKEFISKMSAIYNSKPATSESNSVNVSNSNSDLLFKPKSKTTISGISVAGGNVVIFAPNQEVEITGDIIQSVGIRSSANSAQAIIIAKSVKIKQNVGRIDAWILTEKMDTCSDVASSNLRSGVCAKPLEINGVVAISGTDDTSFSLKRTAGAEGAGDGIGQPAEIFRLNADSYQWIFGQTQKEGIKITTTYSKELPVRF